MQSSPTGSGDPKFLHYCYVCNTQLNSCKQAMLHCSGKRHRKKLFFLQTRKHAFGGMPPSQGFANIVTNDVHGRYGSGGAAQGHPLPPMFLPPPPAMYPTNVGLNGVPYPPMPLAMSPATLAGTDTWLHSSQPNFYPQYQAQNLVLNLHSDSHPTVASSLTPDSSNPLSPASSSPLLSSEEARSAVISPSDASSLSSSDLSSGSRTFKCFVCGRHYPSYEKLHIHLQVARHFKHFYVNYSREQHLAGYGADDRMNASIACTVSYSKKTEKLNELDSRSSSTSSDPIGDSGYVSGGGEEIVCILSADGVTTLARFRCQICAIDLESAEQAQSHATSTQHILEVTRKCKLRRKLSVRKESFEEGNNNSAELSHKMEELSVAS